MQLPTTWSFSRWQTHTQCPLKYKLQFVDKAPYKQSPAMARGDKVHKGIASFIMKQAPAMPAEVATPFQQDLIMTIKEDFPSAMVEQKWGFSKRWNTTPWMGKEVWLRSILDVGLLYDDHTAEVIDWKTGKKYGSNDDQVELFALTTMMKFREDAQRVTTRLVYIDAGVEDVAEFNIAEREKLLDKWNGNANRMLSDTQFFPRPNDKCMFCDFAKSKGGPCRYG